jgi:hypothetical protein
VQERFELLHLLSLWRGLLEGLHGRARESLLLLWREIL